MAETLPAEVALGDADAIEEDAGLTESWPFHRELNPRFFGEPRYRRADAPDTNEIYTIAPVSGPAPDWVKRGIRNGDSRRHEPGNDG